MNKTTNKYSPEVRELKQANEILRKVPAYFAPALIAASGDCRAAGALTSPTFPLSADLPCKSPVGQWLSVRIVWIL